MTTGNGHEVTLLTMVRHIDVGMSSSSVAPMSCGDQVYCFFHEPLVMIMMSTLLMVEVACVIIGITFQIQYLESEVDDYEDVVDSCQQEILNSTEAGVGACSSDDMGTEFFDKAERFVYWVSIVILSIFLLESFVLFAAKPATFITSKGRVLDLVVVVVSLSLELTFERSNMGGLVVILRLWRFVRIGHGVYDESSKECDSCQSNAQLLHRLDSLNNDRGVLKAYEAMLDGRSGGDKDTELRARVLHAVGAHLQRRERVEEEAAAADRDVVVSPRAATFPATGGEDVYTRM